MKSNKFLFAAAIFMTIVFVSGCITLIRYDNDKSGGSQTIATTGVRKDVDIAVANIEDEAEAEVEIEEPVEYEIATTMAKENVWVEDEIKLPVREIVEEDEHKDRVKHEEPAKIKVTKQTEATQAETTKTETTKVETTKAEVIQEETVATAKSVEETVAEPAFYLSDEERRIAECIVMGEAGGEPYDGQVLVAQCLLNACIRDEMQPSQVRKQYKYSGWKENVSDSVKEAVSAVFDDGYKITDEPILYFYAPNIVKSGWHESQRFIIEVGCHRFFALW